MLWSEILSGRFEDAVKKAKGVCVMVVGCVEQHGNHLPLGQDVIHTAGVVELAAKKEPVVIFPHMYFGEKQGAGVTQSA
jgi:creatinine amidohydrolase